MTKFLGLTVLKSRFEAWEKELEEDVKAFNKRAKANNEECFVYEGFVQAPVESLEDASDYERCLTVLESLIEARGRWLEEDIKAFNERATENNEECIVYEGFVKAPVESLEDASDYEKGLEKSVTRDKNIAPGGDTQGALRNKRKRPEMQVPSTKDNTALHRVKETATLAQRIEILDWYHANGRHQTRTAKHFDIIYPTLKVKQPLVSSWLKHESKWWEEWENSRGSGHSAKRTRLKSLSSSSSSSPPVPSSTLDDPTDPIVEADKSDDLVATGAHQTVNPINTDVLSILPKESGPMEEAATQSEIHHDPQKVHKNETEDVGSNNPHVDTPRDSTRRLRPTPKEALQAALVLKRYLAAIDDPFARKMEADLVLFIDQIRLTEARRNLKPTLLTDYFPRK